mgnify:CR=1 FL=1|jgi:hypothetical protein
MFEEGGWHGDWLRDKQESPRCEVGASQRDLTAREHILPVGPSQSVPQSQPVQGGRRFGRRLCLLKGCESPFTPRNPWDRYCSEGCRTAARRWQQRESNRHYRATQQGKARRRAQSRRYRRRKRSSDTSAYHGGEGYHQRPAETVFRCVRPGCYCHFTRTTRSPLQKFCSTSCRKALRRVLLREQRWRRMLGLSPLMPRHEDEFW